MLVKGASGVLFIYPEYRVNCNALGSIEAGGNSHHFLKATGIPLNTH